MNPSKLDLPTMGDLIAAMEREGAQLAAIVSRLDEIERELLNR